MTDKHFEYIGWIGFVLIIGAYLLVTIQFLSVNSNVYHIINLTGALCMVVNAKHIGAKPIFWLNVVWSLIAIFGLVR